MCYHVYKHNWVHLHTPQLRRTAFALCWSLIWPSWWSAPAALLWCHWTRWRARTGRCSWYIPSRAPSQPLRRLLLSSACLATACSAPKVCYTLKTMKIPSPAQQTGATVHFAFGKEICRVVYETCADSGGCSQEQFVDFSQYLVCPPSSAQPRLWGSFLWLKSIKSRILQDVHSSAGSHTAGSRSGSGFWADSVTVCLRMETDSIIDVTHGINSFIDSYRLHCERTVKHIHYESVIWCQMFVHVGGVISVWVMGVLCYILHYFLEVFYLNYSQDKVISYLSISYLLQCFLCEARCLIITFHNINLQSHKHTVCLCWYRRNMIRGDRSTDHHHLCYLLKLSFLIALSSSLELACCPFVQ